MAYVRGFLFHEDAIVYKSSRKQLTQLNIFLNETDVRKRCKIYNMTLMVKPN